MKSYTHQMMVSCAPDKMFRALSDVASWPRWDEGLDSVTIDEPMRAGAEFFLRPKGAGPVRLRVTVFEYARAFGDEAFLFLGKLESERTFSVTEGGTLVHWTLRIRGPLWRFWDWVLARKMSQEFEEHTQALARFAHEHHGG